MGADPLRAFGVFTAIGLWWPLSVRSVLGPGSAVGFVDGRLVEWSPHGETAVWGTSIGWVPGEAVALTWHPGRPPQAAGRLTVRFIAAGPQTLVTLNHSGWEGYDDPVAARHDYNQGWPRMLGLLRDQVNERAGGGDPATPPGDPARPATA